MTLTGSSRVPGPCRVCVVPSQFWSGSASSCRCPAASRHLPDSLSALQTPQPADLAPSPAAVSMSAAPAAADECFSPQPLLRAAHLRHTVIQYERSQYETKLYYPDSRVTVHQDFFSVRIVQLWNKLPEEVLSASSVSAFISRLNSMHVSFFNVFF